VREPSFWWDAPGAASALLSPLAAVYGAAAAKRMRQPGHAAGIPVVCVGNLTVGGAGKTPTAISIARLLTASGHKVFFLSRGYGGRLRGPVRVDVARHRAADVGDEPLLLAKVAPTVVARDRIAGAELAHESGATIIVMDDGFQNPSLAKDFSLLVLDGPRGVGNSHVIPAGPLRAPLRAQLAQAHALLVIGMPLHSATAAVDAGMARGIPVFQGRLDPDAAVLAAWRGSRVLAFAGIGDPGKFFATLEEAGVSIAAHQGFPDHHRYSTADVRGLLARAARENLLLVTTEKDLARIQGEAALVALAAKARALPVTLQIAAEEALARLLPGGAISRP
jgi:tetraacyldisaccharide 4'-kinase